MSATQEQQAPGCFASPSVHSTDSTVCQACPAFVECGNRALVTLQEIRQLVDVRDLLARHAAARARINKPYTAPVPLVAAPVTTQPKLPAVVERTAPLVKTVFEITAADQAVIDTIGTKNIKARDQALALCRAGKIEDMRTGLRAQMNPFISSGPKYFKVACDMLMNGGFTKATFKTRLMESLGWSDGTAGSHVAVGTALLYSFGITQLDERGFFVVNPALMNQNI